MRATRGPSDKSANASESRAKSRSRPTKPVVAPRPSLTSADTAREEPIVWSWLDSATSALGSCGDPMMPARPTDRTGRATSLPNVGAGPSDPRHYCAEPKGRVFGPLREVRWESSTARRRSSCSIRVHEPSRREPTSCPNCEQRNGRFASCRHHKGLRADARYVLRRRRRTHRDDWRC